MPEIRETGKIYCIEDAHTRSNTSSNVHGEDFNDVSVAVGRHSQGYQCYGFFRFAAHGIPENAVIVSAVFGGRVYERLQSAVYQLTARPCGGAWTDTEITYKTMPTSAGVSDAVSMGNQYSYFDADITAIAQAWFSGAFGYDNGLYITSSEANSYKRVYSCTAADDNKPYIEMTYYVPASRPTTDKTSIEIAAGTTVGITANRLSDEYTHTLTWALGAATGTIAENVADTYAWTLTDADVSALLAALPAAVSGTLKIVCETFDAVGTSLGTESAGIAVTVPESVKPKVSEISITGLDLGLGVYYLQGVSRMQVDVTAEPGAGSTLASVIVTVDGKKYSGASITTDVLTGSGKVGASVAATDARGRTVNMGSTSLVPVYAYSAPKISAFAIDRCNEDGTAAQIDGEHLRLTLDASSSLITMPSVNPVTAKIYTKLRSETDWTLAAEYSGESTSLALDNAVLPGVYSPLSSYDVRIVAADAIGLAAEIQTVIPTATCLMHRDTANKRLTFGRIGESTDPTGALITALDLIAEAGVSLHGADVENGQIDLPDGGMIAASASFAVSQDDTGAIRTLESVTVTATGKNQLAYPYLRTSQTVNTGIVYTVNADGTIHANGTPGDTSAWSNFQLHTYARKGNGGMFALPAGNWKLVCEGAKDPYKMHAVLYTRSEDGSGYTSVASTYKTTESAFITTEYCDRYYAVLACGTGYAPDNETFKIMIVPADADTEYEPYQAQVLECGLVGGNLIQSPTVEAGYINSTSGALEDNASHSRLIEAVPVQGGVSYRLTVTHSTLPLKDKWVYFYDNSGAFIERIHLPTTNWIVAPEGAVTARIAFAYAVAADMAAGIQQMEMLRAALPAAEVDFAAGVWRETWGYIASYAGETVPAGWISSTGALGTGAQVAYPLATPIEHAIAPQLIVAPAGPNIITTNADALAAHAAGGRIFHTLAQAINALGRT